MTDIAKIEPLKVGDILCCSWGCTMTLVDFYIVKEKRGAKSVRIAPLGKIQKSSDGWSGTATPDTGNVKNVIDKTFRDLDGSVKISEYQRAYRWDGEPIFYNTLD